MGSEDSLHEEIERLMARLDVEEGRTRYFSDIVRGYHRRLFKFFRNKNLPSQYRSGELLGLLIDMANGVFIHPPIDIRELQLDLERERASIQRLSARIAELESQPTVPPGATLFVPTGEVRAPKTGEWYLGIAGVIAAASRDIEASYERPILRRIDGPAEVPSEVAELRAEVERLKAENERLASENEELKRRDRRAWDAVREKSMTLLIDHRNSWVASRWDGYANHRAREADPVDAVLALVEEGK